MSFIEDGAGSGNKVQVDTELRIRAATHAVAAADADAIEGDAYLLNTGTINLTSATVSAVWYLKNTGSTPIIVSAITVCLGTSTGGSGDALVEVLRGPTAGTLVSAGTAVAPLNRDFTSSKTLTATCLKGAEGSTATDGGAFLTASYSTVGVKEIPMREVRLPANGSIAVRITPPSTNSSQNVQVLAELRSAVLPE